MSVIFCVQFAAEYRLFPQANLNAYFINFKVYKLANITENIDASWQLLLKRDPILIKM
jgi:hypothetical protein